MAQSNVAYASLAAEPEPQSEKPFSSPAGIVNVVEGTAAPPVTAPLPMASAVFVAQPGVVNIYNTEGTLAPKISNSGYYLPPGMC